MGAYIDPSAKVSDCALAPTAKVWQQVYLRKCTLDAHASVGDFTRAEDSRFGEHVSIQRNGMIYSSSFGRRTYTGKNLTMWHAQVGAFSSISWNVSIGGANHDYSRVTTHAFLYTPNMGLMSRDEAAYDRFTEPCRIGNDVWIGADAVICRNVTIGDGAVIGAGAVVTHDVAPYQIVTGMPARPMKFRFSESVIEALLQIRWWEFEDSVIQSHFSLFSAQPTPEILEQLMQLRREHEKVETGRDEI